MSETFEPPKPNDRLNAAAAQNDASTRPENANSETLRMVVIALAIVLFGLTLGVLFLLPKMVSTPTGNTPEETVSAAVDNQKPKNTEVAAPDASGSPLDASEQTKLSAPEELEQTDASALREQAQTLLAEADEKLTTLESKRAEIWASEKLKETKADLATGETAYSQQRYSAAVTTYKKVIVALDRLEQKSADVLTEALAAAELAIASGNSGNATAAFERALLIDPDNSAALAGIKRAANLDKVLALINEAQGFEQLGETPKALSRYETVLNIDANNDTARQAINRIKATARDESFRAAMSRGFRALEDKKYQNAQKQFGDAAKIKPNDSDASEALSQASDLLKSQKIQALMAKANKSSQQEDWRGVEKALGDAKRLDAAISGVDARINTARSRQSLEQQLLKYTSESERLRTDAVHDEAQALLANAKRITSPGPKLVGQINSLENTITLARTRRTVTITSDAKTEVTVYKVGKFGNLTEKRMSLFPGKYTVVGKRRGYKDVRIEFNVVANNSPQTIDVRCNESLQFGAR